MALLIIRNAQPEDAFKISSIYNYYIENTAFTFEENAVSKSTIQQRIEKVQTAGLPWIVAMLDDTLVGYAYATRWRERSAYRFSVESTVYVANDQHGNGIGAKLYNELFTRLKLLDIKNVIGGITLPNLPSVALHEKLGMTKVAHFPRVGFKFEKWLDVGYWQLNLID